MRTTIILKYTICVLSNSNSKRERNVLELPSPMIEHVFLSFAFMFCLIFYSLVCKWFISIICICCKICWQWDIWDTCSRNDFPLEISWCFPKKVFSLVFLGVLIFYAIELGSVSFIKSWVGHWILHNKFVWGCPKYCLNSHVFWSTI